MKIEINARNIVNTNDIDKFLKDISKNIDQQEIKQWIFKNLKTYIKNDYESVSKVTQYKDSDPEWLKNSIKKGTALEIDLKDKEFIRQLNHILDYFKSNNGILSKIKNIDFKEAVKKSNEWTKELHKDASSIPDESGESVVRKYPDGVTWKRLLTVEALATEGKRMDHCVGGEEFQDKLKKNKNIIYSLRDKNNNPQCTIEVEKNKVEQIKGQHDGSVDIEFLKYCRNFIDKPFFKPYTYINSEDKINIGLIEVDGKNYDIYNLVDNLTINENLYLPGFRITFLPDNLTINGNLDISYTSITELPKNLKVNGDLYLRGTKIPFLPDNLTINGKLDLSNSRISKLPENLTIELNLDLENTRIEELPESLNIGRYIFLSKSKKDTIIIPNHLKEKVKWM